VVIVGDDYWSSPAFLGVRKAFDNFFSFGAVNLALIEDNGGKCRVSKPL
jgi:hypothetical protein